MKTKSASNPKAKKSTAKTTAIKKSAVSIQSRKTAPSLSKKPTPNPTKGSSSTPNDTLPLKISNPDKVFWPDEGYTKLQLANFYAAIFPKLQPYVEDRMLSLERCPDGMRGSCFYQKESPSSMPPGTPTKRIAHAGKSKEFTNYVLGGALETQLALVNLGCIALHISPNRASGIRQPDWLCFDMDPQTGKFSDAAQAGLYLKELLDAIDLTSFPKTSGSRGLHIFIPLKRGPDIDDVKTFAENVVARLASQYPKELTVEHSIAARGQRVYLDPYRNGFAQTVVAPYSVRRRPHAPYSAPLDWSEVKPDLDPASFNIGNFQERMKGRDPWADFFKSRQSLTPAIKALAQLQK